MLVLIFLEVSNGLLPNTGLPSWIGHDYRTYVGAADRWLEGGSYYHPYQLTGPYPVVDAEILYPPLALLLFAPFTVLPAILWWAIPLGIIGAIAVSWRPHAIGWALILMCIALPTSSRFPWDPGWSIDYILNGNPGIWTAAAVALATRWSVFGPVALLKITLAPFALVGIRDRSWWLGLLALGVVSVPFGSMWLEYVTALSNARTNGPSLLYSLHNVPLMLIPLIAWASSQRRQSGIGRRALARMADLRRARTTPPTSGPPEDGRRQA